MISGVLKGHGVTGCSSDCPTGSPWSSRPSGSPGPQQIRGEDSGGGQDASEVRTWLSQEGAVGITQSQLYPLLSLQGPPGLPGGVGQPGAVGEKVRERENRSLPGAGRHSQSCLGGGCSGCQDGNAPHRHFASCRVSQVSLETQDPQESQASL